MAVLHRIGGPEINVSAARAIGSLYLYLHLRLPMVIRLAPSVEQ
ncbi:hypothetical protein ACQR1W_07825 [Bradyrhizobium sp. HKCCYLS1011]